MKRGTLIAGAAALILCSAVLAAQVYGNHVVRKHVEEYSANLPPDFELNVEKSRYSLFGRSARISGVSVSNKALATEGIDRIKIDEIVVYKYDTENETPYFADLEIQGIAIPDAFADQIHTVIKQVGLSGVETANLKIDVQSRYRFELARKEFIADRNNMQIRGLGGIQLKFHLENIDPALFQQEDGTEMNPFLLIATIGNIRLVSADVLLEVGTLTDRVFDALAQKSSMTIGDLKEKFAAVVEDEIRNNPGISGEVGGKILDFINEPGDMKITLSPEKPVSVMEVLSMSERGDLLAQKLNMRIEKL